MPAPNLALVGTDTSSAPVAGFEPYIPSETQLRELTWLPLLMGTVLGAIFGASSLYLVLKVGLTVSASIPVAVISITLFRLLSKLGGRDATIGREDLSPQDVRVAGPRSHPGPERARR